MPQVAFSPVGNEQFFDNDGKPLSGGKLFFYNSGSFSWLRNTYADYTGQVINSNPIVLDSAGRPPTNIFINILGRYNATLTQPDGTTVIETWENFSPVSTTATIYDVLLLNVKTITSNTYQLNYFDANNTLIRMNTTSNSLVIIPNDNTVNFPTGTSILVSQIGNGTVTTTSSNGVTVLSPFTRTIGNRYGKIVMIKTGANLWEIDGNLEIA